MRIRHELARIDHLSELIADTEQELARLSASEPWCEQAAFLIQMPGIGMNSAMTILAAIGEIERFASADELVGYAGLGGSASGERTRTGKITKQGRRELRSTLIECAWVAITHSAHWREQYQRLKLRKPTNKAITAIARKMLVSIWHVLTRRVPDRHADVQATARYLMTWATEHRLAARLGLGRLDFVKIELDRLGIRQEVVQMQYQGRVFQVT